MEVTIRGLSEKGLENFQTEFAKKSHDLWFYETEEDYYTVTFFCEGIVILKEALTIALNTDMAVALLLSKSEYQDIEIR